LEEKKAEREQVAPSKVLDSYWSLSLESNRHRRDGSRQLAQFHQRHSYHAYQAHQDVAAHSRQAALETQIELMRQLFIYERYCRDVYAERSRRLLSRAKETYLLREQNTALQDQLALAERAVMQLRAEVAGLRDAAEKENHREKSALKQAQVALVDAADKTRKLECEVELMKQDHSEAAKAREKAEKELAMTKRELWCSQQEAVNLRKKAEK
jgi:hypothetical protein